jgi:hypothetical protein
MFGDDGSLAPSMTLVGQFNASGEWGHIEAPGLWGYFRLLDGRRRPRLETALYLNGRRILAALE